MNIPFDPKLPVEAYWPATEAQPARHEFLTRVEAFNYLIESDSALQSMLVGSQSSRDSKQLGTLKLWTTNDSKCCPEVGYLVPADVVQTWMPCLEVAVPGVDHAAFKLSAGFVEIGTLNRMHIVITAKQSNRQKWLTTIWSQVDPILKGAETEALTTAFHTVKDLTSGLFDNADVRRLLMMLHYESWERTGASDEVRMREIVSLGVPTRWTKGAFGKKMKRLGLRVEAAHISTIKRKPPRKGA